MKHDSYRREAFTAYAFPVGLFLVFPYLLIFAAGGVTQFIQAICFLPFLLAPIALAAYTLAPWAGRATPEAKMPAFVMSAVAAVSPSLVPATEALLQGMWSDALPIIALWALFAIPASLLGALMFIGACERSAAARKDRR